MYSSRIELESGINTIRMSPAESGIVELIVRRPQVGEREIIDYGEFDVVEGLVGDNWLNRGFRKRPDGSAHPDMQINIMNSRCISLIAKTRERWKYAGDQLYIDLDLSKDNLPAGTILEIGTANLEITNEPHLGCKKFLERFGKDAVLFVNSEEGKLLNLRGVNARVTKSGIIRTGDRVRKDV